MKKIQYSFCFLLALSFISLHSMSEHIVGRSRDRLPMLSLDSDVVQVADVILPSNANSRTNRPQQVVSQKLFDWATNNNVEALNQFLAEQKAKQMRVNLNFPINGGHTPLIRAVYHNRYEFAKLLLDSGADVNYVHHHVWVRNTALHQAVLNNNYDMVVLLCSRGANFWMLNSLRETPYWLVKENKDGKYKEILAYFDGIASRFEPVIEQSHNQNNSETPSVKRLEIVQPSKRFVITQAVRLAFWRMFAITKSSFSWFLR